MMFHIGSQGPQGSGPLGPQKLKGSDRILSKNLKRPLTVLAPIANPIQTECTQNYEAPKKPEQYRKH